MIKFFRKIRQQLLMENKTGKYFKYAIGETLLVIIGILIALQVSNWNQKRIDTNSYNIILNSLVSDLENDIKELTNLSKVSNNQNNIIVNVLNNKDIHKDSLSSIVNALCLSPESFTPNKSSFDILANYGSFDLLKLEEVSTDVQSLFNSATKINQESYADRNKLIAEKIRPFIMKSGAVSIDIGNNITINNEALIELMYSSQELKGYLIELHMVNHILITKRLDPLNNKFKDVANNLKTKSKN